MAGHVCQYPGCEEEATSGKFGRTFCAPHNEQVKEEKAAEKEAEKTARAAEQAERRQRTPMRSGSLKGQIRDAVMMTAAVAAIRDPRIYMAVEATVDEFAVAWDNVAKQNPTARRYIEAVLNGGVWISAVGATVVMVVTTLAVTDRLPVNLHPLGHFCVTHAGITITPEPVAGGVTADGAPAA